MVAIIAILAAIAIPQFAAYRQKAEQAAMDSSLRDIRNAAADYQARTGNWPCSMEELQLRKVTAFANTKKWELVVNCDQRLSAVIYSGNDGKKHYRSLTFESGETDSGLMDE